MALADTQYESYYSSNGIGGYSGWLRCCDYDCGIAGCGWADIYVRTTLRSIRLDSLDSTHEGP